MALANIDFTLPMHTISEANRRGKRGAKMSRVKQQRHLARLTMQAAWSRGWDALLVEPGGLVVCLHRAAPSDGLDDDNLRAALKAVRDGIADAMGIDDRDKRVRWAYAQSRGPYSVSVRVVRGTVRT